MKQATKRTATSGPVPWHISHRQFAESASYCKLELSPLMAALFDAAEGTQPVMDDQDCVTHFGCLPSEMPTKPKRTVVLRVGGRGGKTSRAIATKILHASWTAPLPTLRKKEFASAIIVGPDLELAKQALSFVKGYVDDSPVLSKAKIRETDKMLELRRPDGNCVRIQVLAATRGGRAVRGRTLVCAAMDEACFFFDEKTGVVNDNEIWLAVLQRVVPEGQVWVVSTPWIEDVGLLESLYGKNFGVHEHALVMGAGTRALNPTWDPDYTIESDMRAQDPEKASREIDGIPMASGTSTFFDPAAIKDAVYPLRPEKIEQAPAGSIVGNGTDLGFYKDCSAHAEVARTKGAHGDVYELLMLEERRPQKGLPLKPTVVVEAFVQHIKHYGGTEFPADLHGRDTAREVVEKHGLKFLDAPPGRDGNNEIYLLAKQIMNEGRLVLPNIPRLISQLRETLARPTVGGNVGGSFKIDHPRKKGIGETSHGDIASAVVLAIWHAHRYKAKSNVPAVYGGFTTRAEASNVMSDGVMDMIGGGTITD